MYRCNYSKYNLHRSYLALVQIQLILPAPCSTPYQKEVPTDIYTAGKALIYLWLITFIGLNVRKAPIFIYEGSLQSCAKVKTKLWN